MLYKQMTPIPSEVIFRKQVLENSTQVEVAARCMFGCRNIRFEDCTITLDAIFEVPGVNITIYRCLVYTSDNVLSRLPQSIRLSNCNLIGSVVQATEEDPDESVV